MVSSEDEEASFAVSHHRRVVVFLIGTLSIFFGLLFLGPQQQHLTTLSSPSLTTLSLSTSSTSASAGETDTPTSAPTSTTCSCPDVVTLPDCSNKDGGAFLGGVDVVEYWSLEESDTGVQGSESHSTTRNGYTFYFKNKTNQKLFESDPSKYTPAYGGFCTWAVTGEYCPKYPWSAECLGPSGNWGVWTIQQDRLYFFLKDTAKELFLEDVEGHVREGDKRWNGWFPDETTTTKYNTQCYFTSADAASGGTSMSMSLSKSGAGTGVNGSESEGIALMEASERSSSNNPATRGGV